jgi:hypothetical protein
VGRIGARKFFIRRNKPYKHQSKHQPNYKFFKQWIQNQSQK